MHGTIEPNIQHNSWSCKYSPSMGTPARHDVIFIAFRDYGQRYLRDSACPRRTQRNDGRAYLSCVFALVSSRLVSRRRRERTKSTVRDGWRTYSAPRRCDRDWNRTRKNRFSKRFLRVFQEPEPISEPTIHIP